MISHRFHRPFTFYPFVKRWKEPGSLSERSLRFPYSPQWCLGDVPKPHKYNDMGVLICS